jgi:hypothetical protein
VGAIVAAYALIVLLSISSVVSWNPYWLAQSRLEAISQITSGEGLGGVAEDASALAGGAGRAPPALKKPKAKPVRVHPASGKSINKKEYNMCEMAGSGRSDGDYFSRTGAVRFDMHFDMVSKTRRPRVWVIDQWDLAGTVGKFTAAYGPDLHVFPALPDQAEKAAAEFASVTNVAVHNFTLSGAVDGSLTLCSSRNGAFIYPADGCDKLVDLPARPLATVWAELLPGPDSFIDTLWLDCNGCQFDLLEALINNDLIGRVRVLEFSRPFFDFQGHELVARWCRIREALTVTHNVVARYDWLFEAHHLKDDSVATAAAARAKRGKSLLRA